MANFVENIECFIRKSFHGEVFLLAAFKYSGIFKCAGKGAVILVTDLVSDFRDRTVLCTDQGFCVLHFLGQDIVTEVHTRVILKIYGKVRFTQPDKCCDILRLDIAVKM